MKGRKLLIFNFFFIYIYIYINSTYILYASCIPKSKSNLFDSHEDGVLLVYDKSLTSSPTEDFSDIVSLHPPIVDFSLPLPEASSCVIPVILLTLPRREVTKATLLSTKYNLRDCELHESNYVRNSDMTIMKSRGLQNR